MLTGFEDLLEKYARLDWTEDLRGFPDEATYSLGGSYVYLVIAATDGIDFPVYVGETKRLSGRLREYIKPQFSASTDFRVGMMVRALRTRGCSVAFLYAEHPMRKAEERRLIDKLILRGYPLLNSLSGFGYRRDADRKREIEETLGEFCDMAMEQAALRSTAAPDKPAARFMGK